MSARFDEAASHALVAKEILEKTGYEAQTVQSMVFLENHFAEFAAKHDEPTLLRILRKTWNKMSPKGHEAALGLQLPAPLRTIIEKAVSK